MPDQPKDPRLLLEPIFEEMASIYLDVLQQYFVENKSRIEIAKSISKNYDFNPMSVLAIEAAATTMEKIVEGGLKALEEDGLTLEDLPKEEDIIH